MNKLSKTSLATNSIADELARMQAEIRQKPNVLEFRVYYFQLLCVTGQWQRALAQLQVCAQLDAKTLPMAQTYREALRCELLREEIFAGKRAPQVLGQPPHWLGLLIEAQQKLAQGALSGAAELRAAALEEAPAAAGTLNDQAFEWICDADSRLGPVVEAIVNGQYYWIPFSQFREIRIDAPEDLRDVVWAPAQFTFANEGQTVALIPSRYVGSEAADDDFKLSRKTAWNELDGTTFTGLGQRLWTTDQDDYALLDVRRLTITAAED
ncbi:MAG: type VI secretion system accessory protein TagJ [Burkholderiaceae bacterium]|nr:type VI secretion system accessory protein TagJ [Burkholderiaceae bacterium]